ncbi:polysaccharide biosynthesis tyrosine autokinase [candidate division KSB1 bacterium]|nr:polysaccharide biosynthesis tyrosine autokinase [candidate division KSB1 bacterium]
MENNNNNFNSNGQHLGDINSRNITIHDYLAIFYRSRWLIVVVFLATMLGVTYYTFTTPPTYEASTTLMIVEKQGMGQSLFDVTGFSQQRTLINNQVEILKSRFLAQEVIRRLLNSAKRDSLELVHDLGIEKTTIDILKELRGSITVSPIRDTDFISLKVKAPSPFEAAFLTKTVAEVYQDMDRDFTRGEISQVVQFLDDQLSRKETDLKQSEETLKTFLEKEKIASLGEEATQIVEQSAEFETLYQEALIDLEVTRKRLDYLKSRLGKSKETLEAEIARVSSPLVLHLRKEMAEIERNIAVYLSQGVVKGDPQVGREREKLNAIKTRLTEEIRKLIVEGLPADDPLAQAQDLVLKILEGETEMASFIARADGLKRVVESYSTKLESLPDKNVQLARLERNRKVDENLYMMMREKFEESRITQAGQIGKVRIIDEAIRPRRPISPKKKLNLILGFIMGLGLGIGVAVLREYMDTSVRRVEDLEALGLSVLGAIPRIETDGENGHSLEQSNGHADLQAPREERMRLVTHFKPKSPVSEAYRSLRTNLQFSDSDNKLHTFLVTSAGPDEGKSTTTANLAISISLQGTRTIVIDSDLRRPVAHKIFDLEKNKGLSNVLIGKATLDEAIQSTNIKNLDVLTSGILPPNPAEMLGSDHMKKIIGELKERYEVCLFDSPPLIAVTDAAVLAKEVDGVLVVVKSGQTNRGALIRGIELLNNVNARILGALLNDVSRENTYGSYQYYYYYHYYYYYGEGGGKKRKKESNFRKRFGDKLKIPFV